ncbi:lytic transglycosylase domain-containing protein [Propylenella binzhouense]|uniref:Lytic transglycosylase domain-containing protein n=1 Tax=Propylenella binzhouense TaxID=2555902 RepID=A0A964T2Y0_9HYPH|nr:lytic transglycosylase domain-containing protein [Propylenella binzhouense]MYZ46967.1 lytic transglycosylase domain-containing protein [Propylenella binzhouense]
MRSTVRGLAAAALSISSLTCSLPALAAAPAICEREMALASQRHQVPLGMLYAVALTETGRRGSLQPFAMNIAGEPFFGVDVDDALRRFGAARRAGTDLIDIGCMQINYRYHAEKFNSVAEMFDPAKNVGYAARFLKSLYTKEGSWTMAVARYHAGPNNNPAQKRYVCAVISNMVASGFGSWTAEAKSFCR